MPVKKYTVNLTVNGMAQEVEVPARYPPLRNVMRYRGGIWHRIS